jgi:hypothetical protein
VVRSLKVEIRRFLASALLETRHAIIPVLYTGASLPRNKKGPTILPVATPKKTLALAIAFFV